MTWSSGTTRDRKTDIQCAIGGKSLIFCKMSNECDTSLVGMTQENPMGEDLTNP